MEEQTLEYWSLGDGVNSSRSPQVTSASPGRAGGPTAEEGSCRASRSRGSEKRRWADCRKNLEERRKNLEEPEWRGHEERLREQWNEN